MKKVQSVLTAFIIVFSLSFSLQSCDKCKNVDCGAHGSCDKGKCQCTDGYSGDRCQTSPCASVDCGEHGTCDKGTCVCEDGYSGEHCEFISRTKFLGTWNLSQDCDLAGTATYQVVIYEGDILSSVKISNMLDVYVNPVVAEIEGNKIIIPEQEPDNDDYFISGNGTINGETISITYKIEDKAGSYMDDCTATLNK